MEVKNSVFTYDHSQDCFYDALGISEKTNDFCMEVVFFSAISNYLLRQELFNDADDAPKSLSTVTGDLEKSLLYVRNEREKDYLLLIFRKYHELAIDAIAKFRFLEMSDDIDKKKFMLMIEMAEVKMLEDEKKKNETGTFIKPSEMFRKITNIKKARYNFEKYLQLNETLSNDSSYLSFLDVNE